MHCARGSPYQGEELHVHWLWKIYPHYRRINAYSEATYKIITLGRTRPMSLMIYLDTHKVLILRTLRGTPRPPCLVSRIFAILHLYCQLQYNHNLRPVSCFSTVSSSKLALRTVGSRFSTIGEKKQYFGNDSRKCMYMLDLQFMHSCMHQYPYTWLICIFHGVG